MSPHNFKTGGRAMPDKIDPGKVQVLQPVMVTGGQPSAVDDLGYDPLHPSWATEVHVARDEKEFAQPRDLVEFAGTDVNGAPLVKLKGVSKPMAIGDLRDALGELEALQQVPHLGVDELEGDDATKAAVAGLRDKPDAPDAGAVKADPDEVARQAATKQAASRASTSPDASWTSKRGAKK